MKQRLTDTLRTALSRLRGQPVNRRAAARFRAELTLRDPLPAAIARFRIEPLDSGPTSGYWLSLRGSFRPREGAPHRLVVTDGVRTVAELPADDDGEFAGVVNLAALGPRATLTLLAEPLGAARRRVADIALDVDHPDRAGADHLQPIVVLSTGRSGTTMVMQLLAALGVAVRDSYPFECRFGQYWAHAFSVLTQDASADPEADVARYQRDTQRLARNPQALVTDPAYGWYSADYVDVLRRSSAATIDAFYRSAPDLPAGGGRYFAEKATPQMFSSRAFWSIYHDPKLLFLVRDPRDTMASVMAFNAKRGTHEFGWNADDTPESYAARFVNSFRLLHRIWRQHGEDAIMVRYESVMAAPREQALRLAAALGIEDGDGDALADVVSDRAGRMGHHRTAARGEESVERWRRDLSPAVQAIFKERNSDFMETFGYPLD